MIKLQQNIILLAILLTPIFTISEVMSLISGSSFTSLNTVVTPMYIKIIKDVLVVLVMLLGLFYIIKENKIYSNSLYYWFVTFVLISLFYSLLYQPLIVVLAGTRWIMYLLLIPFIYNAVDELLNRKILQVLKFLFLIAIILQVIEILYMPPWFGVNFLGVSNRNPGFYTGPAAMAFFNLLVFFYVYFYEEKESIRNVILYLMIPVSIYLTSSGTGTFIYMILVLIIYTQKIKERRQLFFVYVMMFALLILYLPDIVGREDLYTVSLSARSDILVSVFSLDKIFFSNSFGLGTNTSKLLFENLGVMDSIYASMVMNIGMVPFLILITFLWIYSMKDFYTLVFFLIYGFFSISTVFLEVFPANLIFAVNLVLILKRKTESIRNGIEDEK